MSTVSEHHQPSGPEGTLSALGCAMVLVLVGIVIGILFSVTYLRLMS